MPGLPGAPGAPRQPAGDSLDCVADVGLVLTGGGARAAYQVGALNALAEIWRRSASPFRIFTGVSAGAINAMSVATGADDFPIATARLSETWRSLTPDRVYRTDTPKLLSIGTRWMKDLSSGGMLGPSRINYLLDTEPLHELLAETIPFSRIAQHVRSGLVRGVAVSTTSYETGLAVTFFDGAKEIPFVVPDDAGRDPPPAPPAARPRLFRHPHLLPARPDPRDLLRRRLYPDARPPLTGDPPRR